MKRGRCTCTTDWGRVRTSLKLTQAELGHLIGVTYREVRRYEAHGPGHHCMHPSSEAMLRRYLRTYAAALEILDRPYPFPEDLEPLIHERLPSDPTPFPHCISCRFPVSEMQASSVTGLCSHCLAEYQDRARRRAAFPRMPDLVRSRP